MVQRDKSYRIQVGGDSAKPVTEGDFSLSYTIDPDREPDGLYNSKDECDTEAGLDEDKGCRDGDDDEIVDRKDSIPGAIDQCPSTKGVERYNGCPDGDEDRSPENPLDLNNDLCPGKKGEVRYGGCPDADGDRIRRTRSIRTTTSALARARRTSTGPTTTTTVARTTFS